MTEHPQPGREALPLNDAAALEGTAPDALRMRLRRGKVDGYRDPAGHIWIYRDQITEQPTEPDRTATEQAAPGLVDELRRNLERLERREAELLADLRAERERAAADRERADILLRHAQEQAARMLPAPGEHATAPPAGQPLRLELAGPTLSTAQAAAMLGRSAATLRGWARRADAPLSPLPMPGPLRWSTADVSRLVRAGQP